MDPDILKYCKDPEVPVAEEKESLNLVQRLAWPASADADPLHVALENPQTIPLDKTARTLEQARAIWSVEERVRNS